MAVLYTEWNKWASYNVIKYVTPEADIEITLKIAYL